GGPLGALLGAALGHNLDKGLSGLQTEEELDPGERERVQTAFFTASFSVMGAVAKADGQVSREEIALAEAVMTEMDLAPRKTCSCSLLPRRRQGAITRALSRITP
ncbi:hypothetical protein ACFL0R_07565, partial [Pseudomonadota bacterium]